MLGGAQNEHKILLWIEVTKACTWSVDGSSEDVSGGEGWELEVDVEVLVDAVSAAWMSVAEFRQTVVKESQGAVLDEGILVPRVEGLEEDSAFVRHGPLEGQEFAAADSMVPNPLVPVEDEVAIVGDSA